MMKMFPTELELRDQFAIHAMNALLARDYSPNMWVTAASAYQIADAMLEVRGQDEKTEKATRDYETFSQS